MELGIKVNVDITITCLCYILIRINKIVYYGSKVSVLQRKMKIEISSQLMTEDY